MPQFNNLFIDHYMEKGPTGDEANWVRKVAYLYEEDDENKYKIINVN